MILIRGNDFSIVEVKMASPRQTISMSNVDMSKVATHTEREQETSKSMDDLRTDGSAAVVNVQRRKSLIPVLDLSGVECEVTRESIQSKEWRSCSDLDEADSRPNVESQSKRGHAAGIKDVLLRLPVGTSSRKDLLYDYVRASMILQRIRSLKVNIGKKETVSDGKDQQDEIDSDSGYVIDYLDSNETEQAQKEEGFDGASAQNPYVQLLGMKEEGAQAILSGGDEADFDGDDSSKPPLYLHHHPSVIDSDEEASNDYYETIVIYEELGAHSAATAKEPHVYESPEHRMRRRTTRLVRGKHRKKLKKYIVKRKSSEKIATSSDPCSTASDDTGPKSASVPETIVESDGNSSEDEPDPLVTLKAHEQEVSRVPLDDTDRQGDKRVVLKRRHTLHNSLRRSLVDSIRTDILDESQYDHMLEVMLSDQEVKQLQDAGAVKIKDISELRAEIKHLVQNAPAVPPPLPGQGRPSVHARFKKTKSKSVKKWSSKSLRQTQK